MSSLLSGAFSRFGAVGGAAIGFGVGHGISPTIRPLVQDIANEAWALHDVRPLDPMLAAQLAAEGLWDEDAAAAEAKLSGINADRFGRMVAEARRGPALGEALEGLRRGTLDAGDFNRAMAQAGMRAEWLPFLRQLAIRLFTVEALANMVIRGALPEAEGAARARLVGYSPDDFALMVAVTGNPPGGAETLDLWNRGAITEDEVDRSLRQSNLKPEWFESYKALRYFIPTVADLVRFAVREVFTPAIRQQYGLDDEFPPVFASEGAKRGLSPEYARAYWAAHWELPSVEQGFRMLHRGVIAAAELNTLLRTKDVMPYWRDKLTAIAYLVPGRVDLRRMLRAEVLTEAEVERGYLRLGYAPADARTLREFAVAERDGTDVGIALRRVYRRAVVARAHAEFLSWSLAEADVRSGLARVGIPARHVDELIPLWQAERDLVRAELTPAQVRSAFRSGDMAEGDAIARLRERGYSEPDARVFLGLTAPSLTPADIARAYARAAITLEDAIAQLEGLGYTEPDARTFLAERRPELSARDIRDALNADALTEAQALERMVALGYTPEDAAIYLQSG